jgi:hypothetical protein
MYANTLVLSLILSNAFHMVLRLEDKRSWPSVIPQLQPLKHNC